MTEQNLPLVELWREVIPRFATEIIGDCPLDEGGRFDAGHLFSALEVAWRRHRQSPSPPKLVGISEQELARRMTALAPLLDLDGHGPPPRSFAQRKASTIARVLGPGVEIDRVRWDLLVERLRQKAFMAVGRRDDRFGEAVPIGADYWQDGYFNVPGRGDWIYFGSGRLIACTKLFDVRICYLPSPQQGSAPTELVAEGAPSVREDAADLPGASDKALAAGSPAEPAIDRKRPPAAAEERMREEARALYAARADNPPNLPAAEILIREKLEKEGRSAPRTRLRKVLSEAEFEPLRRSSGKPIGT